MVDKQLFRGFEYEPYLGGYKITDIREDYEPNSATLYIPDGTTAIGSDVFSCAEFYSIVLPKSIIEIEEGAFAWCESLRLIEIPSECRLRRIGYNAFAETQIERLTLPSTLEEIDDDAFQGCELLKSVNFAFLTSLRRIGANAFEGCASLETAALPDGLRELESEAFAKCTSLKFAGIPSSVKKMEYDIFDGCTSLEEINIDLDKIPSSWDEDFLEGCNATVHLFDCRGYTPISKMRLKPYAYGENKFTVLGPVEWGCIENLNLHPDIVDIAKEAFKEQLKLRSFKANAPYVVIGSSAFELSGVKHIDFKDGYIGDSAFLATCVERAILAKGFDYSAYRDSSVKSFVFAEGTEPTSSIPAYTFYHTRFTELKIPDEITDISHHAFKDCVNLVELDLGRVTRIGESGFESCGALKEIIFPRNNCLIWERAFKDCFALQRVEIQDGNSVSEGMFEGCISLTEVVVKGRRNSFHRDCFARCPLKRLVLSDSYSTEFYAHTLENILSRIIAKNGDKLTIVFKDKTIVKTKLFGTRWN